MPQVNIADLTVSFAQTNVSVLAVHGISLGVDAGESVGILGEAGSGKSVTCRAVLRLLHEPPDRIAATHRMLDGVDMPQAGKRQMAQMGGSIAAIIFQDPLTAFDPVFTIGHQIFETIQLHHDTSKPKAQTEATALLARTNIKSPNAVMNSQPHLLSGGMLQRAMIAMALSCRPKVLFVDVPTIALDVTVRQQILQLMKALQVQFGIGLIMVTHDPGVIAKTVDPVIAIYRSRAFEDVSWQTIFDNPAHPYTATLTKSVPGQVPGQHRLIEIEGALLYPSVPPTGCPHHPIATVRLPSAHNQNRHLGALVKTTAPPFVSCSDANT